MATHKLLDTVCGFPEEILISQTPMVCRLLLKSSGSISHKYQSTKKWLNYLTKMLQTSIDNASQRDKQKDNTNKNNTNDDDDDFLSFDNESNTQNHQNKHKNTKQSTHDMDLNGIWSSLCLLSASYRIITSGCSEWRKHCEMILDLTEKGQVFYNPVLRTRCFETLCEIIEYSRFASDPNSYQLSLQIASKLIRFVQNLLFEIVLNRNESLNCGGKLLHNVLMILYRLLSNGKNLNAKSNICLINKACFACLQCNDPSIRSLSIGIIILLCNNDKKYNALLDETVYTLRHLLRGLFPSQVQLQSMDRSKCIAQVLDVLPSSRMDDMDSFERIALLNHILNGLMHLLCHLLRRKNNKSLFCMNASNSSSSATAHHIKIVSASCSMNSYVLHVPLKSILMFVMDIASICCDHESMFVMNELCQNALWVLASTTATLSKSILPYASVIAHILVSIAKQTKALKCTMEHEIRSSLYECIAHIVPILGPAVYDALYDQIKIHLIHDLKGAQKLLMSSPPNALSVSQQKKQKLITSANARKKQKLNHEKTECAGICRQRTYDTQLAFYGSVLRCVSSWFDICGNYMSLDEKSEMELILSASVLRCCSDGGHILIHSSLMDLLNEFISTMVAVLRTPKLYKKAYLSLTAKLLSSSFAIGTLVTNKGLIQNSMNGLRYIESVVNPRSIPVYNKPLGANTNDGASLRSIEKWNNKMEMEMRIKTAPDAVGNTRKRTFTQFEAEQDDDEEEDTVDGGMDVNDNDDEDKQDDADHEDVEYVIKDYQSHQNDEDVEPLWSY